MNLTGQSIPHILLVGARFRSGFCAWVLIGCQVKMSE